jgi:phosphoesterase RecJ-like protein
MPTNNITLEEIAAFLREGDNFQLLCHKRPDGDTLGSALALMQALQHMGKTVYISCAHTLAANNRFLFEDEEILVDRDYGDVTLIAVDVASLSLLGELEEYYGDRIALKIDHHEMGEDYAERNYVNASAAACGEIIYEIIRLLGTPLSLSAEPLYAALSSDTGGFRYSNTTPRTHRIAAELIEAGVDHAYVDHQLFENRTQAEIRALTAAYTGLRYFHDGMVAAVVITNQMKERLSLNEEDLGVLSSLTREIDGVVVGITLKQSKAEPQKYKLSVRSEPGFPANTLCGLFGGGGHPCAAGAELEAPSPEKALLAVVKRIGVTEDGLRVL